MLNTMLRNAASQIAVVASLPGSMPAPIVVRSTNFTPTNTTAAIPFSWTAPTPNNLLLACISWKTNVGSGVLTPPSTAWVLLDSLATPNSNGDGLSWFGKPATVTDTAPTWTAGGADYNCGVLMEISGADYYSYLNGHINYTDSSSNNTTIPGLSISPTVANCLALSAGCWDGDATAPNIAASVGTLVDRANTVYHPVGIVRTNGNSTPGPITGGTLTTDRAQTSIARSTLLIAPGNGPVRPQYITPSRIAVNRAANY